MENDHGSTEEATNRTQRKATVRGNARKSSKSARKKPVKRTVARATPRKRPAYAKLKGVAKKARKKVRARKPPSTPVVETVVVDVVEEPVPRVTVVTEFEATEVRAAGAEPEESQGSPITDQEISILCDILERSNANLSADKRRLLDQLIVKRFVEPANQEGPAKYELTGRARQLLAERGVGLSGEHAAGTRPLMRSGAKGLIVTQVGMAVGLPDQAASRGMSYHGERHVS